MGVLQFFGILGKLIYTLLGGILYDIHGRSAPFAYIGVIDTLMVILALYMVATSKLKND